MEAIGQSGLAVGVLTREGVVLAAEKRMSSKLLDTGKAAEKMFKIDDHIACAAAGITSDANILINYCRVSSQQYLFRYDEPVPMENLLMTLCDTKQGYTQYGGALHRTPTVPCLSFLSTHLCACPRTTPVRCELSVWRLGFPIWVPAVREQP